MTPRSGHKVIRGGQLLDVCVHGPAINDRIGAIVAGRRSDIAFLDLDHPNLVSLTDPVNQIVHAENGRTVDNVMVGSRLVLDGGRFSIVNVPEIRRKVTDLLTALTDTNRETKTRLHRGETVVEQFSRGRTSRAYHLHHVVCE